MPIGMLLVCLMTASVRLRSRSALRARRESSRCSHVSTRFAVFSWAAFCAFSWASSRARRAASIFCCFFSSCSFCSRALSASPTLGFLAPSCATLPCFASSCFRRASRSRCRRCRSCCSYVFWKAPSSALPPGSCVFSAAVMSPPSPSASPSSPWSGLVRLRIVSRNWDSRNLRSRMSSRSWMHFSRRALRFSWSRPTTARLLASIFHCRRYSRCAMRRRFSVASFSCSSIVRICDQRTFSSLARLVSFSRFTRSRISSSCSKLSLLLSFSFRCSLFSCQSAAMISSFCSLRVTWMARSPSFTCATCSPMERAALTRSWSRFATCSSRLRASCCARWFSIA
mmetsp:Transcript_81827/g.210801  ORF Transcript_81827/g.210801 Transcript_81827/m.210801 type:complete len:341 (+) Transcript_81827:135-1157(+)